MRWLNLFRKKQSSANLAKERLQIILAHERGKKDRPDYLPLLQKEIMQVIAKYVNVDQDQVNVHFDQKGECSILELNITLPEEAEKAASNTKKKSARRATTKNARPIKAETV